MKMFPLLWSYDYKQQQRLKAVGCPRSIPWDMVEPHRERAYKNHTQSLETLASRGGLGTNEMVAVLEDVPWSEMISTELGAVCRLLELISKEPNQ